MLSRQIDGNVQLCTPWMLTHGDRTLHIAIQKGNIDRLSCGRARAGSLKGTFFLYSSDNRQFWEIFSNYCSPDVLLVCVNFCPVCISKVWVGTIN